MKIRAFQLGITILITSHLSALAQSTDSTNLIIAEGKITGADNHEPVSARITYQSLPYGNKVGVLNGDAYTFPMFDGEKYSITVEADGFLAARYMLDPADANAENKVIRNVVLTKGNARNNAVAIGQVMRLNTLIFEVGNSRIDPESFGELDLLANMMKENPTMVIQLEGHTDYVGIGSDNLKLSQRRVQSVRDYLGRKGIAKSRIKTKAFGGTQPLSRDDTPEAHRLNRRVEVRILAN